MIADAADRYVHEFVDSQLFLRHLPLVAYNASNPRILPYMPILPNMFGNSGVHLTPLNVKKYPEKTNDTIIFQVFCLRAKPCTLCDAPELE